MGETTLGFRKTNNAADEAGRDVGGQTNNQLSDKVIFVLKIIIGGKLIKFFDTVSQLNRKAYPDKFIRIFIKEIGNDKSKLKQQNFIEKIIDKLNEEGFKVLDLKMSEETGYYEFKVNDIKEGGDILTIDHKLYTMPEFIRALRIFDEIRYLFEGSVAIISDDPPKVFNDINELIDELMNRAKKGLHIQRYKGLGEMNPEQLWKTTMDPSTRNLLQVQIDDFVEADDIFNILMGNKVESRREFIQNNALEVKELDI